jgi:hypothetical protein
LDDNLESIEAISALSVKIDALLSERKEPEKADFNMSLVINKLCALGNMLNELACLGWSLASMAEYSNQVKAGSRENFI